MINSLRKVSIMYMCHNLNDTNIWDSLFEDLPKCIKDNESQMPPQVRPAPLSLTALYPYLNASAIGVCAGAGVCGARAVLLAAVVAPRAGGARGKGRCR